MHFAYRSHASVERAYGTRAHNRKWPARPRSIHDRSKEQGAMGQEQKQSRGSGKRPHWRFEDLEIWQSATEMAVKFHRIADQLDARRLYRYAEQLRGAGLSLSNNIARPVK